MLLVFVAASAVGVPPGAAAAVAIVAVVGDRLLCRTRLVWLFCVCISVSSTPSLFHRAR